MLRLALALLLLFACVGRSAAQAGPKARISMSASSNRVSVGEPFAVEIRLETHGDDPDSVELPDFGSFQVLGRSTSRPFSFSFGFGSGGQQARVKSETIYGFTLRATERGAFNVRPAIVTMGGRRIASQPLNIIVADGPQALPTDPGAAQAAGADDAHDVPPAAAAGSSTLDGAKVDGTMFLRTVVDKQRAYLGEQVTVSVYLYLRGQLGDSPSITREPTLDGFWSQDLLPMQRQLSAARQEVQGRTYSTYVLRRFAAFPLRDGTLEVGAPAVEVGAGGSIFDMLNGPGRPTRRDGVKVSVEVLPLPAQPHPGTPSHTGTLALEATLDSAQAKVGEAVTLRVKASGVGNLRALSLPAPTLPKSADIDVLAPEIDDKVFSDDDVIRGERTFRWLLLPRAPGQVTIPSFSVDVFDPSAGTFSSARSAALKLTVSGVAAEPKPALDEPTIGETSEHFGPVRPLSALSRRSPGLAQRGFFWPAVLAAPLLLLALSIAKLARRRLAVQSAGKRDSEQLREVHSKLDLAAQASQSGDASTALSALASALKKAIEARLGEPVGGMTLRALEAHLARHALEPKLATRVVAQLAALERGRFDPGSQGIIELGQAVEGVRAVVRDLERFRAKGVA